MRSKEELLAKYAEQKERAKTDESATTAQGALGQNLRNIGLSILEWVLGLQDETPSEDEIFGAYIQEIERHVRFKKGMRSGKIPFLERNIKTAWLGFVLGIPEDEIKRHQMRHSVV